MTLRYTLRLVEHGAEVWQRWTGDREEALRDLARALVDLDCPEPRARRAMKSAADLSAAGDRFAPGDTVGCSTLNQDLTVELSFEVRRPGPRTGQ